MARRRADWDIRALTQTAFFAPRGLPGFLYWLALSPFHRLALDGLIDAIRKQVEKK